MAVIMSRRALFGAAATAATVFATARHMPALAQSTGDGPFNLPKLPYAAEANEPHIDAATMNIHHDRHHAGYVANLNSAVKDHSRIANMKLHEVLRRIGEMPEELRRTLRNNAGGHANHTMFWTIMGGKGGQPSGDVAQAIGRDLGGFDKFKSAFNRRGGGVFGSGWVFVTVDGEGKLALASRPNQDTPLMDGQMVLMGNDVWEHAYYLKYRNRRAEYLDAWWNVVDWAKVEERYKAARAGTLEI